jgi:hypothetical protein
LDSLKSKWTRVGPNQTMCTQQVNCEPQALHLGCTVGQTRSKYGPLSDKVQIEWLSNPDEHDYPAALSYLSLHYDEKTAASFTEKLKSASLATFKAKDIFRASGLSLLGVSNSHVERDRKKIRDGKKLSPLLLVRDAVNGRVIIADGYHRLCAVYSLDEDAMIPCKII